MYIPTLYTAAGLCLIVSTSARPQGMVWNPPANPPNGSYVYGNQGNIQPSNQTIPQGTTPQTPNQQSSQKQEEHSHPSGQQSSQEQEDHSHPSSQQSDHETSHPSASKEQQGVESQSEQGPQGISQQPGQQSNSSEPVQSAMPSIGSQPTPAQSTGFQPTETQSAGAQPTNSGDSSSPAISDGSMPAGYQVGFATVRIPHSPSLVTKFHS